jgi:hypothetical protein
LRRALDDVRGEPPLLEGSGEGQPAKAPADDQDPWSHAPGFRQHG